MVVSFRDFSPDDKSIFLLMAKDFYLSPAVAHNVDTKNFEETFEAIMNKSPFLRGIIIESDEAIAGYTLLSFTYSNEFGGLVVLIEEVYITKEYREQGFGSKLFEFLEQDYPHAKLFRMEVTKDNKKAINLYHKLGYQVHSYLQMIKENKHE